MLGRRIKMELTAQEVCDKYKVAMSSLKSQFKRTQEKIKLKTGVLLEKQGRGENTRYIETYPQALTYDDELNRVESFSLVLEALSLADWQLLVLICVLSTPFGAFRGNGKTFLEYYRMGSTETRIREIENAVKELEKHEWIEVIYDKTTDEGYFTIYVKRAMEKQLIIEYPQIETCRQIMDKYKQRSFIPLLKVWLATEELQKIQPYTVKQLQELTGLSEYAIRESNKLLVQENIYGQKKIYVDPTVCLGRNVEFNAYIPTIEDNE